MGGQTRPPVGIDAREQREAHAEGRLALPGGQALEGFEGNGQLFEDLHLDGEGMDAGSARHRTQPTSVRPVQCGHLTDLGFLQHAQQARHGPVDGPVLLPGFQDVGRHGQGGTLVQQGRDVRRRTEQRRVEEPHPTPSDLLAQGVALGNPGEPARRPFEVAMYCWQRGLYVRYGGDTVQFGPAFVMDKSDLAEMFNIAGDALKAA